MLSTYSVGPSDVANPKVSLVRSEEFFCRQCGSTNISRKVPPPSTQVSLSETCGVIDRKGSNCEVLLSLQSLPILSLALNSLFGPRLLEVVGTAVASVTGAIASRDAARDDVKFEHGSGQEMQLDDVPFGSFESLDGTGPQVSEVSDEAATSSDEERHRSSVERQYTQPPAPRPDRPDRRRPRSPGPRVPRGPGPRPAGRHSPARR